MRVSRGAFLKACGALVLGRAAGSFSALTTPAFAAHAPTCSRATLRLESASAARFRPHLYSRFTVYTSAGARVPVILSQVVEQPLTPGVEQFSLAFHAPPGAPVLHGTTAFRHDALGEFELFIAPVGAASAQRTMYEACFSRFVHHGRLATGDDSNG